MDETLAPSGADARRPWIQAAAIGGTIPIPADDVLVVVPLTFVLADSKTFGLLELLTSGPSTGQVQWKGARPFDALITVEMSVQAAGATPFTIHTGMALSSIAGQFQPIGASTTAKVGERSAVTWVLPWTLDPGEIVGVGVSNGDNDEDVIVRVPRLVITEI